jgi:hypothetical protein
VAIAKQDFFQSNSFACCFTKNLANNYCQLRHTFKFLDASGARLAACDNGKLAYLSNAGLICGQRNRTDHRIADAGLAQVTTGEMPMPDLFFFRHYGTYDYFIS